MESNRFFGWKVRGMQEYLVQRGVTASNLKKDKLEQLCKAVETLNLPVDPDFTLTTNDDLQSKLTELPGCIKDPITDDNFTNDFSEIPTNFCLFDIFNYLLNRTSDYDKKKLRAYKSCEDYRLFVDGNVESLTFNSCGTDEVCMFRAMVKPTQKDRTYLNSKFYHLWFTMKKSTGEVLSAYCNCIGGMDGACRHVSAALYELEDFDQKSVTDGENKWLKRARSHDCPVPIKSLRLVKAKYSILNEVKENNPCNLFDSYDPRMVDDRKDMDISEFSKQLQQVQPDIQALDILDQNFDEELNQDVENSVCLIYSIREKIKSFRKKYGTMQCIGPSTAIRFRGEGGKFLPSVVSEIEQCTRGQSKNSIWEAMRYGMLTASNFRKICSAVDKGNSPPSLIKSILLKYNTNTDVPSLQWGKKKERVARELYSRVCRTSHKKAVVGEKGLFIMGSHPFIGCSVDGVFSCQCHGRNIVEIKCPYTLKNLHPKEVSLQKGCSVTGTESIVTKHSEYYHQMQGQMGIYGIPLSNLVIYTKKGIHVSELEFDAKFFSDMIKKLEFFFDNILFEHLIDD